MSSGNLMRSLPNLERYFETKVKNFKIWLFVKNTYNNSLRRLLGLPSHNSASDMFVNLNSPSFGELLRKYMYVLILLFVVIICLIFNSSLIYELGGMICCRRSYNIILCIILCFVLSSLFLY